MGLCWEAQVTGTGVFATLLSFRQCFLPKQWFLPKGVVSISPAVAGKEGTGELSSVCQETGLSLALASARCLTALSSTWFRFMDVLRRSLGGTGLDRTGRSFLCLTSA